MDSADIEKNKMISCLSYVLFFLPLVSCPESKYGRFHANQGLVYLILFVVCSIAISILRWIIPGFFYWLLNLLSLVVYLPLIGIGVIGIMNAYSGKAKDIPFFGTLRLLK